MRNEFLERVLFTRAQEQADAEVANARNTKGRMPSRECTGCGRQFSSSRKGVVCYACRQRWRDRRERNSKAGRERRDAIRARIVALAKKRPITVEDVMGSGEMERDLAFSWLRAMVRGAWLKRLDDGSYTLVRVQTIEPREGT